jgi:hypothetical protein
MAPNEKRGSHWSCVDGMATNTQNTKAVVDFRDSMMRACEERLVSK